MKKFHYWQYKKQNEGTYRNAKWPEIRISLDRQYKKEIARSFLNDCNKLLKYTTHILSTYLIVFLIKIVFDMFAINCIFQKSGSKFYKTITK